MISISSIIVGEVILPPLGKNSGAPGNISTPFPSLSEPSVIFELGGVVTVAPGGIGTVFPGGIGG